MIRSNRNQRLHPPQAYLTAQIDTAEAAKLLRISQQRWRQIAGTRADPNLQGTVQPGQRGARWAMRHVLQFAMTENRAIDDLPPLLPDEAEPRYQLQGGAELVVPSMSPAKAWAWLCVPTRDVRCGIDQAPVLVLAPLWPNDWPRIRANTHPFVREALAQPRWQDQALGSGLTVVLLPIGDNNLGYGHVRVQQIDADELDDILALGRALRPGSWGRDVDDYLVPAQDAADSLGWPAMPWWPEGTATRSTCSRWRPGHPVEISVPESMRDRVAASTWLTNREPGGLATRPDFDELARMFDPARTSGGHWDHAYVTAPDGYEPAVTLRWDASSPDRQPGGHPFRALDHVMADPDTPETIAATIHGWLGDHTYAAPARYDYDNLPHPWPHLLRRIDAPQVQLAAVERTPRWSRLLRAHHDAGDTIERLVTLGPLHAPAVLGNTGVTFAAPTGYHPDGDQANDTPGDALWTDPRDPMHEILLMPSTGGALRGLYRTVSETIAPLPAKASWMVGLEGQAAVLTAAFTGRTTNDALHTIFNNPTPSWETPMYELLAQITGPVTLEPAAITRIATETLEP